MTALTAERRRIYEFTVEELPGGGLRAVHDADPALLVEAKGWEALDVECMAARIVRTWRLADERRERKRRESQL
ncbi:hypothetical protein [Actinomadura sp. NPDC048394]|jgi:hypothetical protein|uniref:hypothetical protein n=1 Tax=Actinomadura sp. NPDC048394 TaxID=3158223 RepID=UPI0033DAD94C